MILACHHTHLFITISRLTAHLGKFLSSAAERFSAAFAKDYWYWCIQIIFEMACSIFQDKRYCLWDSLKLCQFGHQKWANCDHLRTAILMPAFGIVLFLLTRCLCHSYTKWSCLEKASRNLRNISIIENLVLHQRPCEHGQGHLSQRTRFLAR